MERPIDRGVVTSTELMYVLVTVLVGLAFLGWVGRLNAAGVQVTNTAQSAARAASLAPSSNEGLRAARDVVASSTLRDRCASGGDLSMTWERSGTGTWQGGSVTVSISCRVSNRSLTGVWSPGARTVTATDTQSIDRYKR